MRERARGRAEPATAELEFSRLLENAQDLIYRHRVTPPQGLEYINSACLAITGHTPEEFYADPNLALTAVHPDDRPLLLEAFQDDPSKLRPVLLLRWIHPDGTLVWAEHRRVPVLDRHGRLIAIEGVGRDVTDRVETQRRLADSELRFRLLAENALDMVYRYRVRPTPGTEYISPAAFAITGYTAEEMMREPTMGIRIVHPDDRQLAIAMCEHAERFRAPTVLRYVRPDGRLVCVEHRNTPIFDDQGQVVAIEGIGRDVTESLAIQNQLRASETQLRRLAAALHSARESERTHVARELHDELGQTLTSLKIDLTRAVRDLIPHQLTPEMIDRMQSMVGGIDVATETVRRLATALRPPALDHLGLAAAIELEGAAMTRRTGLRVRSSSNLHGPRMTNEQTTAVFRIVQEALTNVVRHAGASAVRIMMRQTPQHISVKIHDNGRGITREALDDPASIGLLGMRERAELIGARLVISGRAGKGTAILITVPFRGRRARRP
jgi:two-component system, NarL family, sensor histidine kinase UhpB